MAAAGSMMTEKTRRPLFNRSGLDLSGRSLIVGLGASGASAARFIHARGGQLRIIDSRAQPPGMDELSDLDAEVITQSLDARWLDDVARVVLSPGLSIDLPICAQARERGIEILNDVELFARVCEAPIIAVTGSNGKSTVVSLLERLLVAAGLDAVAGGNLGTPALDLLDRAAELYVLEVSSFQMETTESLAPHAAAVLNVTADHLDRHTDMSTYAALKEKLLRRAHTIVTNVDDPRVRAMAVRHPRRIEFSVLRPLQRGYSVIDDAIAIDGRPVMPLADLAMPGRHNVANVLAALALAATCTERLAPMLKVLREFTGLPHRCEAVATINGVSYINDSKATNTGATAAALAGLPGPLILIAGGVAKGADFTELRDFVRGKVRAAVLIGEAAAELGDAIGDLCQVARADTMGEAVALACEQARPGDTVILSPACASLDMFADYTERGRRFRDAVRSLAP
ncbi:MAG: UDP-N-acetylmuramoyl-L-alanine--D-glutamate ligase [Gammaproteobacteria bacterium]|jgi:UDP-N-acetylmuramoylalanine--D-glutamate ligase